ncbi:hypothetical protein Bca4012_099128 [Brassica carinata]|uniref:(rape) hypothetical protein n=1 Tax=Brassica napus TaxID=3708 RepID=A0A816Q4S0_BRANA|nr:unnamed protein product [Brassica napus]
MALRSSGSDLLGLVWLGLSLLVTHVLLLKMVGMSLTRLRFLAKLTEKNILQCGGVAVPLLSISDTPFCVNNVILRCDGFSELLGLVIVLPFGVDLVISQFRTGFQ